MDIYEELNQIYQYSEGKVADDIHKLIEKIKDYNLLIRVITEAADDQHIMMIKLGGFNLQLKIERTDYDQFNN